jgi:hypothetical protein
MLILVFFQPSILWPNAFRLNMWLPLYHKMDSLQTGWSNFLPYETYPNLW